MFLFFSDSSHVPLFFRLIACSCIPCISEWSQGKSMFPHQTPRYPNIPGRTCVIWYQSKCQLISVSLIERLKGYNKASVSLSRLLLRFTPVVQYFAAFSSQAAFFFIIADSAPRECVVKQRRVTPTSARSSRTNSDQGKHFENQIPSKLLYLWESHILFETLPSSPLLLKTAKCRGRNRRLSLRSITANW